MSVFEFLLILGMVSKSTQLKKRYFVFVDFFVELDERLGPLTLRSSLRDLVRYVQAGIKKLREL